MPGKSVQCRLSDNHGVQTDWNRVAILVITTLQALTAERWGLRLWAACINSIAESALSACLNQSHLLATVLLKVRHDGLYDLL